MEWKSATYNDQGLVTIPKRWLHIHYYEALNILFRFENSLRVFLYAVLKNEYFDQWKECSFSPGGGEAKSIKGLALQRISQAENFGYLGFSITAPLMHLTSGELVELITSEAYWKIFKIYFKGNKDIIKNKLLEIGTIRNSLAHFRPIKPEDIGLVKQNTRHTLLGVEACLKNIFTQSLRVPTNTQDEWYASISALGTDEITTTLYYSADEEWVNIRLRFDVPTFHKKRIGEGYLIHVLAKVNTPNILINSPQLTNCITYVSESVGYPALSKELDIKVNKDINIVIRKDVLIKKYELISAELTEILKRVSEECHLLVQDNLARGQLIESARATSWWHQPEGEEGTWKHSYDDLWQPYDPSDPDEYWGTHQSVSDIVGGCRKYPWMPSDISEEESFWD